MSRTAQKPAAQSGAAQSAEVLARGDVVAHTLTKTPVASVLDRAVCSARDALLERQSAQGYWCFELEADCTIPAEYIMMMHFLDEIDVSLERKLAVYLRTHQAEHGGWPLYHGGDLNISCTIKAYYALKLAGDDPDAPHMVRARAAILARGGVARANVFTRIALALFGQLPWRGVPYLPVEIMLLPKWFPFHLDKIAYWSRTVMVPLFILCTLKPVAKNPRQVDIGELFTTPPEKERHYFRDAVKQGGVLAHVFLAVDRLGRLLLEPLIPRGMRARAMQRAEEWMLERLNGEDGLGAIFPAMVNALEVMVLLGYPDNDPRRIIAKRALQKLVVESPSSAYCQPCVSPVWDTAWASIAMQEIGEPATIHASTRALDWLQTEQILDEAGDWRAARPRVAGGGWAFQFANPHYPDLDDTAVVAWSMHQAHNADEYGEAIRRALDWLVGMQSANGGFAAFDADNTYYSLNRIPFADHGALLDPPTSDVTARVVTVLARVGRPEDRTALSRAIEYLRNEQEDDGSWFGRWGTNYLYGTWSVLTALAQAGIGADDPMVGRAVEWLKDQQNADGGWGESNDTYARPFVKTASTPYQTAWAVLALMAAGQIGSEAVRLGVGHLLRTQRSDGLWSDATFTAPGFPRVFYLKYHGYSAYFPLWALALYRTLTRRGPTH
ncbi:MAG TPA: squalene--hopene cyclase [Steroidobacteraceae bacterium]|nr:squalene--hopene cyclase [Steroidobacteraceae bacterium]